MVTLALCLAVLAIALSSVAATFVEVWRRERIKSSLLADRLEFDARMEVLTTQTLGAMNDAARRYYNSQNLE